LIVCGTWNPLLEQPPPIEVQIPPPVAFATNDGISRYTKAGRLDLNRAARFVSSCFKFSCADGRSGLPQLRALRIPPICSGHMDMRAHTKVLSVLRSDTPA